MTMFQWIGLPLLLVLLSITLAAGVGQRITRRMTVWWSLVWIAAFAAIARPEITIAAARLLGVGRGADLVLYVAILGMLTGFFLLYVRFRKLEQDLTRLVRHLALHESGSSSHARREHS